MTEAFKRCGIEAPQRGRRGAGPGGTNGRPSTGTSQQ